MSKLVCLIFIFCLFYTSAFSQKKSDLEKSAIRGKVKKIESFRMSFDAEKGWVNRQRWLIENFNADGNITERELFQDGQISSKTVSFYDARGRNIGNNSYSAALDKTLSRPSRSELLLDEAGNTIELKIYSRNSPDSVDVLHKFKYDARGNQIERDYGRGGKSVLIFDEKNNPISIVSSNGDGIINGKTFTEYDALNRAVKTIIHRDGMFYKDARLRYEISFKYDDQGRIVERMTKEIDPEPNVIISHAPEPGKTLYKYDDAKRAKQIITYTSDGYLKEKSIVISDERGKEIGFDCSSYELETCRLVLKYEYDSQGNWISKTSQAREVVGLDLKSYFREERVIAYY